MSHTLGVDPGADGAGTLLDPRARPVNCWRWRPLRRKGGRVFRLDDGRGASAEARMFGGIASLLALAVRAETTEPIHLSCEGLFMPDDEPERAKSVIELARSAGIITAPFLEDALTFSQPPSSLWRPAMLGTAANVGSDEAERAALLLWRATWKGPALCTDPHVAESAAIASWDHVQRRQLSLLTLARRSR